MADAMTLVSTVTVGSGGAASIDFNSIPQTYTDLFILASLRGSASQTGDYGYIRANGDTGSNYTYRQLIGNGGSATSTSGSFTGALVLRFSAASATSSTFGNNAVYIPNYAGSTQKSFSAEGVGENNATAADQSLWASLWTGTSAITSLSLLPGNGSWVEGSTASLYGILKGSGGATVS